MRIATMKRADRFVGVPLCWILGAYRSMTASSAPPAQGEIRNILVMKFFGLGSIVLATPALSIVKKEFPRAHVTFLSFSSNRELLERIPLIDNVETIRTSSIIGFVRDTLRILRVLHATRYEIVFDFEFFSKFSTLLSGCTGAPRRVGFELPTRWRSMLVTDPVPLSKRRHVAEAFCSQVFALTGGRNPGPLIPPDVRGEDEISLLGKIPLNGGRIICINPNAGETFLERRWEPARFSRLVSLLSDDQEVTFYFIGSEHEYGHSQRIIENTSCRKRCYNVSGVLTVPELAVLLRRSQLLISNDSGPIHLAAALGVRVIGLYGPETPLFYGPATARASIIYKSISCSPCMNIYDAKTFSCPYDARCMKEISVEEVHEAVSAILVGI